MSRKAPILFLILTAVLALFGLGIYGLAAGSPGKEVSAMSETTLIIATDLHYLAPELTDHGTYFEDMVTDSDGKVMDYIEELTDAFLAEVIEAQPAALILSGDVSFNGARMSHEALAAKLRAVAEAGVPVLVMPGNHDLENSNAAAFRGDGFTRVGSVTAAEFATIYADCGFATALARDAASLSYMYEVSPGLRVLMLDVNTADSPNTVKPETLAWAEAQLADASLAGAKVVAVSHQNVFKHNSVIYSGYLIENADDLLALYKKNGVLVNLSGHLHCQHISHDDSCFYEIATSSLAVSPNQYGVLTLSDHEAAYATRITDVSAWAARQGMTDPNLLDFAAYSLDFFRCSGRDDTVRRMADDPDTRAAAEFFTELNVAYFSGRMDTVSADDPGFDILGGLGGFAGLYALSLREEAGLDSTKLTVRY